jgi:starvation-inducible DNA-binding protein
MATSRSATRSLTNGRGRGADARAASPAPAHHRELQRYGTLRDLPIALPTKARADNCELLNQILADTTILASLYKKHHWLVAGPTFYQLHLLFDKHADEQFELIDLLAERVQSLGGIAISDPRHVAEVTRIERPPNGAEDVPTMIGRLLDAHETVIAETRQAIERTEKNGDWSSNDLLMGDVLRTNEIQVWFVAEHVVPVPLVESSSRS